MRTVENNPSNYKTHPDVGSSMEEFPKVHVSDVAIDIMRELDKLDIKFKKYYREDVEMRQDLPPDSIALNSVQLLTDRKHVIASIGNISASYIEIKRAELDGESTLTKGRFLITTIYNQRTTMNLIQLVYALEDGFL